MSVFPIYYSNYFWTLNDESEKLNSSNYVKKKEEEVTVLYQKWNDARGKET
uniref:Uncharacterized protein n=1 Tax=Rhizophagus irregularis (strain DAOM 181602 / DAOM 197198 / MUCL 43194) TaxID=747089 RepID=U9UW93_RHIID